jgi:hypothetical protein
MSYSFFVGIKGADKDIEALRVLLDQAVEGECSNEVINDFFKEIGIDTNPLAKGEKEFSLSEEDSINKVEIDNPYPFFSALSEAWPALDFFCIAYANTDDGNGVEYSVYKEGKQLINRNEFFDGDDCGGYVITRVPADACAESAKSLYALWRIIDDYDRWKRLTFGPWSRDDLEDFLSADGNEAIKPAHEAYEKAWNKFVFINDFLLDGGIDCLDRFADSLRFPWQNDIDVLLLMENEGGYEGYSIANIKTVDYSDEDYREDLEELPDLSAFTGLETLNLRGCCNLKELPSYITEKAEAGELKIIGWPANDDGDSEDSLIE